MVPANTSPAVGAVSYTHLDVYKRQVQIGMGISISPINIIRQTNTNKAGVQEGKNAGMAPMAYRVVEHGVYCMPFFVNPNYAHKSGCTVDDIELMKQLMPYAYDMNRSAIRPDVRLRHVWYIEHKNVLGSCPDYLLLEALTPERIGKMCIRDRIEYPFRTAEYTFREGTLQRWNGGFAE